MFLPVTSAHTDLTTVACSVSLFPQRGTCAGTAERVGQDQSTNTFGRCVLPGVREAPCLRAGRRGASSAPAGPCLRPVPSADHCRPCGSEDELCNLWPSKGACGSVQRRWSRRHRRCVAAQWAERLVDGGLRCTGGVHVPCAVQHNLDTDARLHSVRLGSGEGRQRCVRVHCDDGDGRAGG